MGGLGSSWGCLRAVLERLEAILGHLGTGFEASWDRLGASWDHLGASSGRLEASWEHLGSLLEAFGASGAGS